MNSSCTGGHTSGFYELQNAGPARGMSCLPRCVCLRNDQGYKRKRKGDPMKVSSRLVLGLVISLSLAVHGVQAQERGNKQKRGNKQMQQGGAAAGAMQGGMQQGPVGFGNVGQQAGQLAQLMLANFDQDRDAALNAAELQVALATLMQRMQANRPPGAGNAAAMLGQGQGMMHQFRHRQGNAQFGAGAQGGGSGRGGKSGGAKAGRGR